MGRGYTIKVVCMGNIIIACSVNVSHLFPATFEFGIFFSLFIFCHDASMRGHEVK